VRPRKGRNGVGQRGRRATEVYVRATWRWSAIPSSKRERAAAGNRIPRGTSDVEGAELPRGHTKAVCRATKEARKRFRDREPSDEEQQRTTEEEARWQVRLRQDHEAAAARWHARLQEAE